MNSDIEVFGSIGAVILLVALFIFQLLGWYECENKGGVYVWDSFQCAAEFKEKP